MSKTHNPFHAALLQRVIATGDTSPGNWNLTADVIQLCALYMTGWTNRFDNASRIPDVLYEAADAMREEVRDEP